MTKIRRTGRHPALAGEAGSMSMELVLLTPVLMVFLFMAIAAGRIQMAKMAIQEATQDAARQASLSRDPLTAQTRAALAATYTLANQRIHCSTPPVVKVGVQDFHVPIGQPAYVTATVTCTVPLADLAQVPGLPGSDRLTFTMVSPLDYYRGR
jgi:Flp pilus assembly protein TadG